MYSIERKIKISTTILGSGLLVLAMGTDVAQFGQREIAEGFWTSGTCVATLGSICLWKTWRQIGEGYDFDPDDPEREDINDVPQIVELAEVLPFTYEADDQEQAA